MTTKQNNMYDALNPTVQGKDNLANAARDLDTADLAAAIRWADALVRVTTTRDQTALRSLWHELRVLLTIERDRRSVTGDREIHELERLFKL